MSDLACYCSITAILLLYYCSLKGSDSCKAAARQCRSNKHSRPTHDAAVAALSCHKRPQKNNIIFQRLHNSPTTMSYSTRRQPRALLPATVRNNWIHRFPAAQRQYGTKIIGNAFTVGITAAQCLARALSRHSNAAQRMLYLSVQKFAGNQFV